MRIVAAFWAGWDTLCFLNDVVAARYGWAIVMGAMAVAMWWIMLRKPR